LLVQDMPRIRQNTIEKFGFHIIDKTMYIFKTTW